MSSATLESWPQYWGASDAIGDVDSAFYGVNGSDDIENEPVDQYTGVVMANRMGVDCLGIYSAPSYSGLFNAESVEDLEQSLEERAYDRAKAEAVYGGLNPDGMEIDLFAAAEMMERPQFWMEMNRLVEEVGVTQEELNEFCPFDPSDKMRFGDAARVMRSYGMDIPGEAVEPMAEWPTPLLYIPAEMTESALLTDDGYGAKIGPRSEWVFGYDQFISENVMPTAWFNEITNLRGTPTPPYTISPSEKPDERVLLRDDATDITLKLDKQDVGDRRWISRDTGRYGRILNPVVNLGSIAVEFADMTGREPVEIGGIPMKGSEELLEYVQAEQSNLDQVREQLPKLLEDTITRRIDVNG